MATIEDEEDICFRVLEVVLDTGPVETRLVVAIGLAIAKLSKCCSVYLLRVPYAYPVSLMLPVSLS